MDTRYEKFFKDALEKFKINSPDELKSDEEKKKFFNYVDNNYKAKNEQISSKANIYIKNEGSKIQKIKKIVNLVVESEIKKMQKK